ncbi:hypothetical protein J7T55_005444 [Diaporthe amygdali]|uniref:uncharacterized protein n=1 Tax=Phomopsis amygdali TaxID=1214568 RepID=UPI0022FDC34E|nr:uncharacterized protein J7T55_005444 [Diaporthe amygdali]KAJ0108901.1 hypothetical protein J7T55_005444 [Diaporthe amygdali]
MSQPTQHHLGLPFPIPHVTEADLISFHDAHFGRVPSFAFTTEFLSPDKANLHPGIQYDEGDDEAYYDDDEDQDGLGYYPDGVKRTLTDEQIAMFRHSETQALQRELERASTRRNTSSPSPMPVPLEVLEDGGSEDGELDDNVSKSGVAPTKKKRNKKKKKRGSGNGKRQYSPDPERRKRTWDVVEDGLDGLDYGESGQSQANTSPAKQRRRITYEDG